MAVGIGTDRNRARGCLAGVDPRDFIIIGEAPRYLAIYEPARGGFAHEKWNGETRYARTAVGDERSDCERLKGRERIFIWPLRWLALKIEITRRNWHRSVPPV